MTNMIVGTHASKTRVIMCTTQIQSQFRGCSERLRRRCRRPSSCVRRVLLLFRLARASVVVARRPFPSFRRSSSVVVRRHFVGYIKLYMAPRWHQGTIAPRVLKNNILSFEKCPKVDLSFEGVLKA